MGSGVSKEILEEIAIRLERDGIYRGTGVAFDDPSVPLAARLDLLARELGRSLSAIAGFQVSLPEAKMAPIGPILIAADTLDRASTSGYFDDEQEGRPFTLFTLGEGESGPQTIVEIKAILGVNEAEPSVIRDFDPARDADTAYDLWPSDVAELSFREATPYTATIQTELTAFPGVTLRTVTFQTSLGPCTTFQLGKEPSV